MWEILLRHKDFVAINKPAGVAVHQEEGAVNLSQTLAQQLGVPQVWLLHRLDKPTSGVLLFALNREAAGELAAQFADKTMRKTYWALGDAKPLKKQGWVKGSMVKSRRSTWRLARSGGNQAVTYFNSFSLAPKLRLFVLQPHTGKTHQLRVALKSLGSPIIGDTLYGGTPAARMFLHARELAFSHQGETFRITAPLDTAWPTEYISATLGEAV
ncbi:TIGR01621 family pseudouridine synthase [Neisseria lisongii]|uniref:TIGR01621 family pseudouridine synthase n=1 Tax=Neisseria lisongii TaxID=2912188 RepID=A0AAW5AE02_9NEIS|nr:TIGR01621 family pseudouridine synthase [Neisseria lisongii]MCF7529921.1 TIGR01621 family pseudouridine synthase [Neisseria lisongii]